mgnify:FL=1|jgi:hypothetical protein
MTELTWEQILAHLKYEESVVIKIINAHHATKNEQLTSPEKRKFRAINRDARTAIWRHLNEKKHVLHEPIAAIELADKYVLERKEFNTATVAWLLRTILNAKELVQRQINYQSIYRLETIVFTDNTITDIGPGFTIQKVFPEPIYASKPKAIAAARAKNTPNALTKFMRVTYLTDEPHGMWFITFLNKTDLRPILRKQYLQDHFFEVYLQKAIDQSIGVIKGAVKDIKTMDIEVIKLNKYHILITYCRKIYK